MTVREWWNWLRERLSVLEDGGFEAIVLLETATGIMPKHVARRLDDAVPPAQAERLQSLCTRRLAGEPLQYLVGEWEFYLERFAVGQGVLIPRPDTETLVEAALDLLPEVKWTGNLYNPVFPPETPRVEVLDLCSGTGCVAISIARERPYIHFTALEYSSDAFAYLEKNISLNGAENRVFAVLGDVRTYTHPRPLDLITANPPYIPSAEIDTLQTEVQHEPRMALDGGPDGLDFYRVIAARYRDQLAPGGWLCLEVGAGQSGEVAALLSQSGFDAVHVRDDYAGIPRIVSAQKPLELHHQAGEGHHI